MTSYRPAASIRLSYHNTLLHDSDVQLLRGPHWLNDLLISFYLEYLEHDLFGLHADRLLFVSPETTQCMKLVPAAECAATFLQPLGADHKQFIFFPINDHQLAASAGGSHWSLLVYSRPDRRFYAADSAGSANRQATRRFVQNIRGSLCDGDQDAEVHTVMCVQQTNGYDCGVHVLWNVAWMARHAVQAGSLAGLAALGRGHRAVVVGENENIGSMRGEILRLIERLAADNSPDDYSG